MIMEHLNYEKNIMDSFRLLSINENSVYSHPLFFPETNIAKQVYLSICDEIQWAKWIDNSGNKKIPPDYYNNELQLMMEVMRVDDNAHIDESTGKPINPIRERESEMIRELRDKGIFEAFPKIENVVVTAKTKLPTDEDHNYLFYRDNFTRVVDKHKAKIPTYQQNHPGHRVIFFVFDESSMYIKLADGYSRRSINYNRKKGPGQAHCWWLDVAFLSVINNSKIDFLIWATPYKKARVEEGGEIKLPGVCIFDVKNLNLEAISYKERRMISTED